MPNIEIRDLRHKQFFMVDDEYLNGYARLCGINATGVYLSLCRHASKDQTCFPSKKLMACELSISERSVYTAVKKLEEWGVVLIEDQGRKNDGSFKSKIYTLVDKKHWKKKPQANGADGTTRHPPRANNDIHRRQQVPNKETHILKETQEEGIAATSAARQESNDISKIIEMFSEVNPGINYGNKTERSSALWLVNKYGLNLTERFVKYALSIRSERYAPVITTPYQLKIKIGELKVFYEKNNKSSLTIV